MSHRSARDQRLPCNDCRTARYVRPRDSPGLVKLKDPGLELADRAQEIRGRKVIDTSGTDIGHVSGLFIDEGERRVRLLEVSVGGFLGVGDHHVLLPVEAITSVTKDEVHVNETRDRVIHSPAYHAAFFGGS